MKYYLKLPPCICCPGFIDEAHKSIAVELIVAHSMPGKFGEQLRIQHQLATPLPEWPIPDFVLEHPILVWYRYEVLNKLKINMNMRSLIILR